MPITSVTRDPDTLTMTVVADFASPVERLWNAYLDPRQLERFWGPPTFPATFTRHDGAVGGRSNYRMTGPDGSTHGGYWEWIDVNEPKSFTVRDGFAGPDGAPNPAMPAMQMTFTFDATSDGSRVTTVTTFNTLAELEQLIEMGMEDGLRAAMGQMDDVLADLASFAAELPTATQILSDTQVRISRVIRGDVESVWRAHFEPELLQRWLLGPDGWTMPVCEVSDQVGDSYRYEWARADGSDRFGFEGEVLEATRPYRAVTSERMIGQPGETRNELTLTTIEGGTLLTLVVTYANAEMRDMILGTGMVDGMETSYRRLEDTVLTS